MSSRNVFARHRTAPVRSTPLVGAVQAGSGNAGTPGHQASGHVAASHLTLTGSPVGVEGVQRSASILSDVLRAPRAVASKKAKSLHHATSVFYTLR